jgi:hypothetical protein
MIKFLISLTLIGLGSLTRARPGLGPRFGDCQRGKSETNGFGTFKSGRGRNITWPAATWD